MPSCVQSQYSPAKHFLLSIGGARWKEINLVMFTVFVDDSGTDPKQAVAIASALVIPSRRIEALEKEWEELKDKKGFVCFHSSPCASKNPKEEFANWSDKDVRSLFVRVRQLTKKYGVKAISYGVHRSDYDAVLPQQMRDEGGQNHYTWAIRVVLDELDKWAFREREADPFEYLIDWVDPKAEKLRKEEIEMVFARKESVFPGRYEGHYEFKKSCDFAGLQCADLLAWSCYQISLDAFTQKVPHPLASAAFYDFENHRPGWLMAVTQTKEQLTKWAAEQMEDTEASRNHREWLNRYRLSKVKQRVAPKKRTASTPRSSKYLNPV